VLGKFLVRQKVCVDAPRPLYLWSKFGPDRLRFRGFKAKKPFSPLSPVEAVPIGLSKVDLAVKTLTTESVDVGDTYSSTIPEQIDVMKLEGYSGPMCIKHVHPTTTRSSHFHCPVGVINKPTMDELWISPVY